MKMNSNDSSESENDTEEEEEEAEFANEHIKRLGGGSKDMQQDGTPQEGAFETEDMCLGHKSKHSSGGKSALATVSLIDREEQMAEDCEAETTPRKKKRKHRLLSINLTNCKYESVRRAARHCGLKEVGEDEEWTVYWTDCSVSLERVMEMKRFQKINHFPGMTEICRKDLLARNLNRMLKLFPKEYSIFPCTWCLPADYGDFQAYGRMRKNRTYICKPDSGCQGRGIFITRNPKEIKHGEHLICQQYISKPFLIDGFKFDLRIYVLVTSCDPLKIFVYEEGLARFATMRYIEPSSINLVKKGRFQATGLASIGLTDTRPKGMQTTGKSEPRSLLLPPLLSALFCLSPIPFAQHQDGYFRSSRIPQVHSPHSLWFALFPALPRLQGQNREQGDYPPGSIQRWQEAKWRMGRWKGRNNNWRYTYLLELKGTLKGH